MQSIAILVKVEIFSANLHACSISKEIVAHTATMAMVPMAAMGMMTLSAAEDAFSSEGPTAPLTDWLAPGTVLPEDWVASTSDAAKEIMYEKDNEQEDIWRWYMYSNTVVCTMMSVGKSGPIYIVLLLK